MTKPQRALPSPFDDFPAGTLRVLQVTDCHLYGDPAGALLGLNTQDSLDLVLDLALARLGEIDVVLVTGDLVHDASHVGYERFRSQMASLGVPVFCLPGNHDVPEIMREILTGDPVSYTFDAQFNGWSLVFLDSTLPDDESGHLSQRELEQLDDCLQRHRDRHTLVCLHHQPVLVGSAWIDNMALDNPAAFFSILDRNPQVRGVLWGHIHQLYESQRNGVPLLASPSSCIQFLPRQDHFGVDSSPPGYRWLALLPDGRIRSGIERLAGYPSPIELDSGGY